jgi:sigma-B regulation protein RsbU (phosphoserine phosphatase)
MEVGATMQIRGKLLILLLVMALVPLGFSAVLNQLALHRLGNRLTTDTRSLLDTSAQQLLLSKVDDYRRILQRDQQTLRLALDTQAREVEHLLAAPAPKSAPVYLAASYDRAEQAPPGLQLSERYFRTARSGTFQPMPISYQEQVVLLVEKPGRQLDADLARISHLTEIYRRINLVRPKLFFWQYTALETGIHSSYPGHGGYPADYDPRRRSWYQQAKALRTTVRQVVTDATTGKPILTLSQPVYRPDGQFAGVTAIDVAYGQLFADWELPKNWRDAAETLVAAIRTSDPEKLTIDILLRARQQGISEDWRRPPENQSLNAADHATLQQDILAGRSGVREIRWQGKNSLVAYSPGRAGEPFPLVIVPLELLHAPAEKMESYLRGKIVSALEISALLLLLAAVWVVLTAYFRAGSVTRPVKVLANAATQLAAGDYAVKVSINTGDELQSLGETFNEVGPQLQEREALKQSLLVAREIQQLLLPATAPALAEFDIAGQTLYCEETGGDYFDYIPIDDHRLALVVGDVTGHGIGSALLMAAARGALRSRSTSGIAEVGELLGDLNRHLEHDTSDTQFMTLFYGILDARTRGFSWVSAGHGPAFHYHLRSSRFDLLETTGIPLGILAETEFGSSGPNLVAAGDILLIGTDGIWETHDPDGEMFGIDRLQQVVAAQAAGSAEEIRCAVIEAVTRFRGLIPQEDDLTLLVIKGLAGGEPGAT